MIPGWLKDKLASPPAAGTGIHAWLFSTARHLHAHMPPTAVEAALQAATVNAARRVTPREIRDAVINSHEVAWTSASCRTGSAASSSAPTPTATAEAGAGAGAGAGARTKLPRSSSDSATAQVLLSASGADPDPVNKNPGISFGRTSTVTVAAASLTTFAANAPATDSPVLTGNPDFPSPALTPIPHWPTPDPTARRCRIAAAVHDGLRGAADLWERSPVRMDGSLSADDWLDWLFPGASFLCLATDHPATARSRPPAKWYFGPADTCGLVVPSPMTGPSGLARDGRRSHRCLDNTGPRRWLVIEFDTGTRDEQAALHWHLRGAAAAMGWPRLALVVSSGGKSLHGWYGLCQSEESSRELMAYARTLGADPATWNRSQLVRLPEGLRRQADSSTTTACALPEGWEESSREIRQTVLFWDPDATTAVPAISPHALSHAG